MEVKMISVAFRCHRGDRVSSADSGEELPARLSLRRCPSLQNSCQWTLVSASSPLSRFIPINNSFTAVDLGSRLLSSLHHTGPFKAPNKWRTVQFMCSAASTAIKLGPKNGQRQEKKQKNLFTRRLCPSPCSCTTTVARLPQLITRTICSQPYLHLVWGRTVFTPQFRWQIGTE